MPKGSIDAVTSQHLAMTEQCYHGELSSEWTLTFTQDNERKEVRVDKERVQDDETKNERLQGTPPSPPLMTHRLPQRLLGRRPLRIL